MNCSAIAAPSSTAIGPFHRRLWRCQRRTSAAPPCRDVSPRTTLSSFSISSSLFGRRARRRKPPPPPPPPDRSVELSIDLGEISSRASDAVDEFLRSSGERFDRFVSSSAEAYRDLRSSVKVDRGNRIVFSCRRSSLEFVGGIVFWGFVAAMAVWVVGRLGFRSVWVTRRDRSLGGREVIVGRRYKGGYRVPASPLSLPREMEGKVLVVPSSRRRESTKEALSKWWPVSLPPPVAVVGKEELQKEADRLVRAIMDKRMSGVDFQEDDIIQLHQICRNSGAKVSFETNNARDSFYRASIHFVLNTCTRFATQPPVQIDGEDAREFIAGLADNIRLEDIRAARLVRAAVAARTRSGFLQSWALEVQGKRSEAVEELLKLCRMHQIFPLEETSPEMDMLASGLANNLRLEQRKHLFALLGDVCDSQTKRIIAAALDLVFESTSPEDNWNKP
ncbi:hypothetical protein QJS10_CPB18g00440 [Acorus calamus]|uniref:Uncharacterized protein n=1 Tax=Acorus calamus TaxID=4465 RepID=A0AAV9CLI8_ACOCL|nr:hypothetical protein QJS10_CPB18g00440 [Acorus calamus]